ncbi:MAG: RtcB family protein [Desulfobacterales bacterium]|nr:RtcB family protein [Desulfobacterales bacterium]
MKKVISSEKLPIKMWLDDIEEGTLDQAKNLANLPFAFKHIAIMPDSHRGYGMPIGGVLAAKGVIIPNAVGVDIGCGMCAVKTNLEEIDAGTLQHIVGKIKHAVPVGFEWHKQPQGEKTLPELKSKDHMPVVCQQYQKARQQVGTLGGGNHFIEVQKGSDGYIWIMIHSGSRNIGKKVAEHYNQIAVKLNEQWFSQVPKAWQLAFLPISTTEAKQYRNEMEYCVEFALANREAMMKQVQQVFEHFFPEIAYEPMINIAHNYAAMENHFNENVMVHRKGATQAKDEQLGIIPGSQGTKSYIVRGKGNYESFMSCSHGAGRTMGRKQAIRELNLEEEKALLDKQGIIHSITEPKDLDEAPSAYKNIDVVMESQGDLVDIVVELTPLAVIKG